MTAEAGVGIGCTVQCSSCGICGCDDRYGPWDDRRYTELIECWDGEVVDVNGGPFG
jgi:hypothetical protein